jgi:hypothetical protein
MAVACGLTLLFTQSQPDWFGAVIPKSHGKIFDLSFEPVNFIFKSLHGIFSWIPCPCPAHFWLVITVCKRQSDFVFCGFVIWVLHHHLKASGFPSGPMLNVRIGVFFWLRWRWHGWLGRRHRFFQPAPTWHLSMNRHNSRR